MASHNVGAFEVAEVGAVMTDAHCDAQIKRLLVLKGIPEDVVEYFAALQDVPDDLFSKAVSHAIRTRHWFPTPAELRADCDSVAQPGLRLVPAPQIENLVGGGRDLVLKNPSSGVELRIRITRIWRFDCDVCADSGWQSHACPADHCGRRFDHAAHEWVTRCDCVPTNQTIQRHRAATAKYAQPPEKV